ncbi:cellulase family glycosylhydrolase [Tautonia rosea]|uniref:cellulase family glycosylhydrolase n=1 Tax=Tautonia rosea TaxID=2728037 RepID=UPI0014746CA6|nr:cellulase family glycosylhydrolase [Tautonia rosea]
MSTPHLSPKLLFPFALALTLASSSASPTHGQDQDQGRERWTPERANAWYDSLPWLVGCNYNPSTAINQLEMWQADTFDPETIDRELGWAEDLGFTSIRVYLHHLLWEQDADGFVDRMDRFLAIADRHDIGVMFVLFDSVWDPHPKLGPQRDPEPGVHNSGWVQSPGADDLMNPDREELLKAYTVGVISRFKDDPRVHAWDLWNEPDNTNDNSYGRNKLDREPEGKRERTLELLERCFSWARSANPSQPLTSGVWIGQWSDPDRLSPTERVQLEQSDIITFHSYDPLDRASRCVENLRRYGRPLLCTEFMARPNGSTFDPILGYFKAQHVGAYCWGFVAGRSNTIYPWDSWQNPYDSEPPVWFHDIFRLDGTPYRPEEVSFIKRLTEQAD